MNGDYFDDYLIILNNFADAETENELIMAREETRKLLHRMPFEFDRCRLCQDLTNNLLKLIGEAIDKNNGLR